MKGVIFLEFLALVEDKFGLDVADDIIESSTLESNAAYTSVGTYPFSEMVSLVTSLSERSGVSIPDLLKVYGEHLLGRFVARYPMHFEGVDSTFELLEKLDNTIHVEVLKLYPEAELPRFNPNRVAPHVLEMNYRSDKPLTMLAYGLITGCAGHFGENIDIEMDDRSDEAQTNVTFTLTKVAA